MLNAANLQSELDKLLNTQNPQFSGFATDAATTAQKWAEVLFGYWAGAGSAGTQCPIEALSLEGKKTAFISTLAAAMVPVGTAPVIAAAFESAFQAVWLGQVFLPGVGSTGGVVTPGTPVPSTLLNLLVPAFSEFASPVSTKVSQLATAFDTATRTVTITVTIPPVTAIEPIL